MGRKNKNFKKGRRDMGYGEDSIVEYNDGDQVRKRPSIIFGSSRKAGALNGIWELVTNSNDEAREGFGRKIIVRFFDDGSVEVEDYGRGVRVGYNEKLKKENWILTFCTLYASGKYKESSSNGEKAYTRSAGLNGVGLSAMQFASEYMYAKSCYDGVAHELYFKEGKNDGRGLLQRPMTADDHVGTIIRCKPDPKVFSGLADNPIFDLNEIRDRLLSLAMSSAGVLFELHHPDLEKEEYYIFQNGAVDYLNILMDGSEMLEETQCAKGTRTGKDDKDSETYSVDVNVAFNFSSEANMLQMYHNGMYMKNGGVTVQAVQNAFTAYFIAMADAAGQLGSGTIVFKDIEPILAIVGTTDCEGFLTDFEHQTKGAIENPFIGKAVTDVLMEAIGKWRTENPKEAQSILDKVLINKRVREESVQISAKLLRDISKPTSSMESNLKLKDCKSKDNTKNEIYMAEGDSAGTGCTGARDFVFQAVYSMGGKILNVAKCSVPQALESEKIRGIIKVLGCGIDLEVEGMNEVGFDIRKLRYSKIIIATDADSDGGHICALLLVFFYKFMPELLRQGKVYRVITPLYVNEYDGRIALAYTEKEQAEFLEKAKKIGIDLKKIKTQRSKGLGENDKEFMDKYCMNPQTRKLVKITLDDAEGRVGRIIDVMMGDDIESRRRRILDYLNEISKSDNDVVA